MEGIITAAAVPVTAAEATDIDRAKTVGIFIKKEFLTKKAPTDGMGAFVFSIIY